MSQIDFYKQMTGEERLKLACLLSDLERKFFFEIVKRKLGPKATKSEVIFTLNKTLWGKKITHLYKKTRLH